MDSIHRNSPTLDPDRAVSIPGCAPHRIAYLSRSSVGTKFCRQSMKNGFANPMAHTETVPTCTILQHYRVTFLGVLGSVIRLYKRGFATVCPIVYVCPDELRKLTRTAFARVL